LLPDFANWEQVTGYILGYVELSLMYCITS
jgi:hypothetical protein